MDFTVEQQLAIDIRDKNILVSAAAGSGKTAVLVNRIIERILSEEDPVDIDRILVMTFTNAAAAQMKERILKAIEEKRIQRPFDKNLQKQAALIHGANISTIDSFCLNVVRNHFADIDMNPDFRIADQGELKLLKQDVIEEVLENMYEEASESFIKMTECFSYGKNDSQIEKIVLQLSDFSESYPEPEEWLKNSCNSYAVGSVEELNTCQWINEYLNSSLAKLLGFRTILDRACDICTETFGPEPYLEALESDIEYIDRVTAVSDYKSLYELVSENGKPSFASLKSLRIPKEGDAPLEEINARTEKKNQVGNARSKYKDYINALFAEVNNNSLEDILTDMRIMQPMVSALIDLTVKYQRAFSERKREKNIVDFNDLEHMCLRILKTSESAASEYRQCFREIYVDEYQDSNLVQEEIIKILSLNSDVKGNLFMVGDVKQSIYGFRMARPEIFVEKYNRYPEFSNDIKSDVKIDLHDNFRSRTHVIDSVNELFRHIMTDETGSIIYDDKAALHAKADYPEGEGFTTEILYSYHEDSVNDRILEANIVAQRIKELMKTQMVTRDNQLCPMKYSDIVILLRSSKDWDVVFQKVLESEGIPVRIESSTGYFSREEVSTLLDYLKVIDNPKQDIPLMTVLRSCIGNLYDEEIAVVRGTFPDGDLYSAVLSYSNIENNSNNEKTRQIQEKLRLFLDELDYYRRKTGYTTVDMIITEIIDEYYGDCILAKVNGKKKYANLLMLLQKAREYGKTSYKGIFHFNRYIETLHKYEVDFGEANLLDENEDAVRIMTIHKSKGLEFPVCFISSMAKKMNTTDEKGAVIADADRGIGVDVIDSERRTRKKSLYKLALVRKKHLDSLSEELRVFYVAMTRAKEKLIMSGIVKKPGDLDNNSVILTGASSYLDFYKYVVGTYEVSSIERVEKNVLDIMSTEVRETIDAQIQKERVIDIISTGVHELPEEVSRRLDYIYPYKDDKSGLKVSVSELKRRSMMISEQESENDNSHEKNIYDEKDRLIPKFIKEMEGENGEHPHSATLRGTAVHRVFEIWDYNLDTDMDTVEHFIDEMHEKKRLETDLYSLINSRLVYNFVNSEIAQRMKNASLRGELRREQPFVIEDEDTGMLIQGIIDAYFYEDDEIVVVDYKTDKVKNPEELVEKYRIQLEYYSKALAMLTGKNIKEKVIYSTRLNKSIIM